MMQRVNRVAPAGKPDHYLSWRIVAPVATHYRPATCAEVQCRHHLNGWATIIDTATPLGRAQADWIRAQTGRRYTESPQPDGMARFEFPPGQTCFNSDDHLAPLEREPLYRRDVGDWRARTRGRSYERSDQWADDFHSHTDNLKRTLEGT